MKTSRFAAILATAILLCGSAARAEEAPAQKAAPDQELAVSGEGA